jgi:pilus assembly protein Flp/PilA
MTFVQKFANDESGTTAIEYGLIAGLMAVVITASIGGLATNLGLMFDGIGNVVSTNTPT